MTSEDKHSRLEGIQYATGEEQRATTKTPRKNEVAGTKWKRCLVVKISGGQSKVRCYKEQYCIETWNVRSMYQGKLNVVKQEMARLKIYILGICELKWTQMGELVQMTIISNTVAKNPLKEKY